MAGIVPSHLLTENLRLAVLTESHAAGVLDYYQKNRDFFREWEPCRDDSFYTHRFHRNVLKLALVRAQEGSEYRFWIFKRMDSHLENVLGTLSFSNIIRGPFLSCFTGYSMDKLNQGKGYMTEAMKAGINFIFNTVRLHRIEANIMPRNRSSLKVTEKCGFKNEGISREYLRINGKWEDHVHMVLLNSKLEQSG